MVETSIMQFKIIPSDFGLEGEKSLVDYRKDIIEQLENIPCNKIIFIDACQSGTIGQLVGASKDQTATAELERKRSIALAELNKEYQSTHTLASSAATESSWEDQQWKNGAFTEAIIGAFNNEPYNKDGELLEVSSNDKIITFNELFRYISLRIPHMIESAKKDGTQHPFIRKDQLNKIKDFPIYEID